MEEQWFNIFNDLNVKKKELKELKTKHNDLTNALIESFIQNNIDAIVIPNSNKKLILNEKKSYGAINKDYILETLNNYIDEKSPKTTTDLAENMTESIMQNRVEKSKHSLKLVKK